MKILQRYIVKTMASYTLVVMLVWLGIYAFFNFLNEIKFIGQADYTLWRATQYVAADLPAVMYSHSPVIILLGSLLALGHLASTSQLVVLMSSGVSIMRIAKVVVKGSLAFVALIVLVGELIAPISLEFAEQTRAKALGGSATISEQGFWLKDNQTIVNVKNNIDGHRFAQVSLIKINDANQLASVMFADKALFDGEQLNLSEVQHYQLSHQDGQVGISLSQPEKHSAPVSFDQSLVEQLRKAPYELSSWDLYRQIEFLNSNNLRADKFEMELYKRLVKPITLIAMILLSMLFVFGSLRDSSLGKKVFIGLMLSLVFELFSRIGGVVSLRFDYNHFLSALTPTLLVLILAFILLQRKSAR